MSKNFRPKRLAQKYQRNFFKSTTTANQTTDLIPAVSERQTLDRIVGQVIIEANSVTATQTGVAICLVRENASIPTLVLTDGSEMAPPEVTLWACYMSSDKDNMTTPIKFDFDVKGRRKMLPGDAIQIVIRSSVSAGSIVSGQATSISMLA